MHGMQWRNRSKQKKKVADLEALAQEAATLRRRAVVDDDYDSAEQALAREPLRAETDGAALTAILEVERIAGMGMCMLACVHLCQLNRRWPIS